MLTRKEFRKYIQFIIAKEKARNEIDNTIRKYDNVFIDWIIPLDNSDEYIVELINKSMNLDGDETISYWLWEGRYFENECTIGNIELMHLPQNHKYRKPDLGNLDKLYDFLVWRAEYDSRIDWKAELADDADVGDIVTFIGPDGKTRNGVVEVFDKCGTAGHPGAPSYDVFVLDEMKFYKHAPARLVYKNNTTKNSATRILDIIEDERTTIRIIDYDRKN